MLSILLLFRYNQQFTFIRDNYRYGQKKKKRKRDKTDDPGNDYDDVDDDDDEDDDDVDDDDDGDDDVDDDDNDGDNDGDAIRQDGHPGIKTQTTSISYFGWIPMYLDSDLYIKIEHIEVIRVQGSCSLKWLLVPHFCFLRFVVCLLSSRPDPTPVGGLAVMMGGFQVPP